MAKRKPLGQIVEDEYLRGLRETLPWSGKGGWCYNAAAAVRREVLARLGTEFVCTSCWERFPEKPKAKKGKS